MRSGTIGVLFLFVAGALSGQEGRAEKDFKAALAIQNEKELEKACRQLVIQGDAGSAKLLLKSLSTAGLETDVYWILVRACAAFSNTNALKCVTEHVLANKTKPVGRDLAMALQNNFTAGCEEVMLAIVRDGTEELKILALDHLADIGGRATCAAIIEALKKDAEKSGEVRRRMCLVLRSITNENYGESASNWIGWWEANGATEWKRLAKSTAGTSELGATRAEELGRLAKDHRVLILHAGAKCKCKKDHDLDPNLDGVLRNFGIRFDKITKDQMDAANGKLDTGEPCNLSDYIAIIAICTHIREHCACPKCKPGGQQSMRLFQ
jgi:hypothetical protein